MMLRTYPSPIDGAPPGTQMGHQEPTNLPVSRSRANTDAQATSTQERTVIMLSEQEHDPP